MSETVSRSRASETSDSERTMRRSSHSNHPHHPSQSSQTSQTSHMSQRSHDHAQEETTFRAGSSHGGQGSGADAAYGARHEEHGETTNDRRASDSSGSFGSSYGDGFHNHQDGQGHAHGRDANQPQGSQADQPDPLAHRVVELEQEVAELKDRTLRALADLENVRRRSEKERIDAQRYAVAPLARDLLGILDNLTLALQSVNVAESGLNSSVPANVVAVIQGVEMVAQELRATMQRNHIVAMSVNPGSTFDPQIHQAVAEEVSELIPPRAVVRMVSPGYMLHDRLLRPARVTVAKAKSADHADTTADVSDQSRGG